jgi:geranylgeranyl pyrophosphate synthase
MVNSKQLNKSKRFALAVGILATSADYANAFTPASTTFLSTTTSTPSANTLTRHDMTATFKTSPVVVSQEAEALSHSETTMKLVPSYELFQILSEEEGGILPELAAGNSQRDTDILKIGQIDTLADFKLSDYEGCGGSKKIKSLPDPFKMVEKELKPFSDSISELVSSDQPILSMAAKHFFEKRHGKRFRPTIVQLVGKAVAAAAPESLGISTEVIAGPEDHSDANGAAKNGAKRSAESTEKVGGVAGWEWSGASEVVVTDANHKGSEVWRKQAQLGQIVEMIHVASLIHDDVLDEADTRRGGEAVHKLYSNKVAVLAGDYLLARASVLLARLENTAVVQIMATALESLVSGEVMQLKSPPKTLLQMESYLRKSYYKTASLICYACRSTALLGGHAYSSTVATAMEEFGFHLGLAFQIQDDILDFTAAENVLGKPALADMDLGLSTAPILYAAQEYKELRPLVMRRFKEKGDKQTALEYLYKNPTAMNKAKALARFHAEKAVDALLRVPQSEARDALIRLTHTCITRKK